jgi:hypothetical protein
MMLLEQFHKLIEHLCYHSDDENQSMIIKSD